MLFNEKKAAQIAAFFLLRGGGSLDILKLMKLMYLAERSSFSKFGEPLTGDWLFSMEHGPVLSRTLNYMNGFVDSAPDGWEAWVSDRANHLLASKRQIQDVREELSFLSDAELEVLEDLWNEYGHLTGYQLRDLTHEICTEWEDPETSSIPIPYSRVLRHVGHTPEVARELEQRIRAQRHLEALLEKVAQ